MSLQKCSKVILILSLSVIILVTICVCLLNQPSFLSWATRFIINKYSTGIIVDRVSMDQVRWFFWQKVSLKNFKVTSRIRGVGYQLSSSQVIIDSLDGLISKDPIKVTVKDSNIISKDLTVSGVETETRIHMDRFKYSFSLTQMSIAQLKYRQYSINDIKGSLNDANRQIVLSNVYGNLYGGNMLLNGWFKYSAPMSYQSRIQLNHVDSNLLSKENPSFSQLTAVVDGDITLKNFKNSGLNIQADLHAPSGGRMKASLLMFLAQYVPQRQQIEDLIQRNEQIPLDKARIIVTSLSSQKISSQVALTSSSINLNMNIKFDFNIEGGLEHLLEYIH